MKRFKVVILDYDYDSIEQEIKLLKNEDIDVYSAQCKTEEQVIDAARDADGIICQYAPVTKAVIEKLENCKVIARYGIGFDSIDVKEATKHNIFVCNVNDYCWDEVSNHALALLLSLARKITLQDKMVKRGIWDYKMSVSMKRLRGQTLGLVGFGHIPQVLAEKAQTLGLNVIAYDPFVSSEFAKKKNVELTSLEALCKASDYISLHTPLNKETKGLISEKEIDLMKKTAYIINTARGPIIKENDLIDALQNNKIAGAGLDVLEIEPIKEDNPLLKMDNVILNPHIAYYSKESEKELKLKTVQNVIDVLLGYYPKYIVNPDVSKHVKLSQKY